MNTDRCFRLETPNVLRHPSSLSLKLHGHKEPGSCKQLPLMPRPLRGRVRRLHVHLRGLRWELQEPGPVEPQCGYFWPERSRGAVEGFAGFISAFNPKLPGGRFWLGRQEGKAGGNPLLNLKPEAGLGMGLGLSGTLGLGLRRLELRVLGLGPAGFNRG